MRDRRARFRGGRGAEAQPHGRALFWIGPRTLVNGPEKLFDADAVRLTARSMAWRSSAYGERRHGADAAANGCARFPGG